MSATTAEAPAATSEPVLPPVRRASLADLTECGAWLLTRIANDWPTTTTSALSWMRSALDGNDQAFMRCGDAFGMAHIESGRLGAGNRVVVDFMVHEQRAKGTPEMLEIYSYLERWAKSLGCTGVYRVDDLSDCDRKDIKGRLGHLSRKEAYHAVFV